MLGVVLVTEHVRRLAALQRRADAIGANKLLGIAETGKQLNVVKVPLEIMIGCQPGKQYAACIGQHDADRLALEIVPQVPQHRQGAAGQRGVQVGIANVGQVDAVGGDVPLPRAPPRRQDRVTHPARADQLTGQELFPGLGQAGVLCHLGPGDYSARHTSPACHDRCRGSAGPAEALEVCVAPLRLTAAGPGDLARGRAGHRRPQPGARHCERHEHGPDNDWAGACAPPVAPDRWPPSVAEARCVSCTLRLHLKTSNSFPESSSIFIAADRPGQSPDRSPGQWHPGGCRGDAPDEHDGRLAARIQGLDCAGGSAARAA